MRDPRFLALVGLEAHRTWALVRRGFLSMVVLLVLFVLLFGRGREGFAMALAFLGCTYGFAPAMAALTDKLDGGLDFLTSLPVPAAVLASARLAACSASGFLAAVFWTASAALVAADQLGRSPTPLWLLGVFLGLGLGAALLSGLAAGVVVRFRLEDLSWLPVALLVGLMAVGTALERLWPGGEAALAAALLTPRSPALLLAILIGGELLALRGSFHLLRSGLERHRSGRPPLGA
jgi:hypothetical protein